MPLTLKTTEQLAQMRAAKDAKRAKDIAWQLDQTIFKNGYQIRPAISKTGGSDNIGWELNPITVGGASWYFATQELCLAAIPRHLKRYA